MAEIAGRILGTIDYSVIPNLTHDGRPFAIVENLVVEREWRRRGIGSKLLAEVVGRARAAGCLKVQLETNRDRLDTQRFYASQGFIAKAYGYRLYFPPGKSAP